ncbi:MAG: TRAM domain-containing protein [bacterium]|nr:TRAM domain-containing protein [bacterium]
MSDDLFEIELTAMAHGGSVLGRHGKQTIFIPYTIPGERVKARITQDKGRIAFAEGVQLLEASADRVYPRCPHFGPGRCGRCHWQHIATSVQPLLKQDILADQLARVGGFDDAVIDAALREIIPSPVEWGYNFHMTLEATPEGELGFPSADGRGITLIEECHILHPDLLALYTTLDMDFSGLQRVRLQIGSDGETMLIFFVKSEEDAPELLIDLPTSINLLLPDNEPVNLIGQSHSQYVVGGRTFRATAGSDFRANVAALDRLAAEVRAALQAKPGDAVLDLYAGIGLLSAFIAPDVRLLTVIESYPPAATDADENLADFDNVDLIEGAVEDVLPTLEDDYAAAVLDPPSQGLSTDMIDLLGAKPIPRLVYVSSDPATLARDGARLAKHGYRLEQVQPFDLAPQTYYIDALAVFAHEDRKIF